MKVEEVKDFCQFQVYEIIDGEIHTICVCKEHSMAVLLCNLLAENDPSCDEYCYTPIVEENTFVPGGGWKVGFHKGKNGVVIKREIS